MSSLSVNSIILTVPSGVNLGLSSDVLNIREANFDVCTVGGVDISTIVVDAAAHIAATSGVHGVTGNVVGTTDSQTVSNKLITSSSIVDNIDTTKRVAFDISGATTGTTTTFQTLQTNSRVITFPDITDTVVTVNAAQALANKTLRVPSTKLVDDADATKRVTFDTSGAIAGRLTTFLVSPQTVDRNIVFPDVSDTVTTLAATQTLTNKTLTAPVISTIVNTGTLTLPTVTDTLVARTTTDTLTNKTLTLPIIASISNGGNTITIPTATTTLVGQGTTDTLSNKTLLNASCRFANSATNPRAVAFDTTLATNNTTTTFLTQQSVDRTISFPNTTDTVVTLAAAQTLTNKTLTTPIIAAISNTGTLTLPTTTDTLVGRVTVDTLTNKTLTAPIISTISNTGTLTLPTATTTLVGQDTTDTLANKTLLNASCRFANSATNPRAVAFDTALATNNTTTTFLTQQSVDRTISFPNTTDTVTTLAATQTLTNKTLTTPIIAAISNGGNTITVPSVTTTLVGQDTTDTLSNKTFITGSCAFANSTVNPRRVVFDMISATDNTTQTFRTTQTTNKTLIFPDVNDVVTANSAVQTLAGKTINTADFNLIQIAGVDITTLINQDVRTSASPTFVQVTAAGTQTSGLIVNQTANPAATANNVEVRSGGVSKILLGHAQNVDESYISSSPALKVLVNSVEKIRVPTSGNVQINDNLAIQGSVDLPNTIGSVDYTYGFTTKGGLSYTGISAGSSPFIGASPGDISLHNADTAKSVNIGLGNLNPQLIVHNTDITAAVTTKLTLVASDETSTTQLCLDGSANIVSRAISTGTFTSTVSLPGGGGFSAFSNAIHIIHYSRYGNIVTCSGVFDAFTTTSGPHIAIVTLPIARGSNFTTVQQAAGVVTWSPNPTILSYESAYVRATTGSNNQVDLIIINPTAAGTGTVICNFQYTLV